MTSVLYQCKVRCIEAAAACSIFTALICYYIEGDRGHLLNAQLHKPERGYAVRGNVYNFHMPWEEIAQSMAKIVESEDVDYLPHRPETFANVVLFSLRFGDVVNLNKWLPQAKPRPHVVLKVPCALVINKYRLGPIHQNAVTLKKMWRVGRKAIPKHQATFT